MKSARCGPVRGPVLLFQYVRLREFQLSVCVYLAPRAGFEPATNRLTAGCSTTELPGNKPMLRQRGL